MGKCSRILLLGGLLLNQAPWTMVVSADSVTEDTVSIQDTVESTIAVEQEETLMSRDSKDEHIHSTKDNDGRNTEPSELSQSDSSEPVELNESTSSSSENEVRSQNEGLKKLCSRGMLLLVRILLIYLVTPAVRGLILLK